MRPRINCFLLAAVVSLAAACSALPLKDRIDPDAEWTLVIEQMSGEGERLTIRNSDATAVPVKKGNSLTYKGVGGKNIDLTVCYSASKEVKGALEVTSRIVNNEEDWFVLSLEGPAVKPFPAAAEDAFLLPVGTGWRLPLKAVPAAPGKKEKAPNPWTWDKEEKAFSYTMRYPSRGCNMQWCALQGKEGGVYVGSHDPGFTWKEIVTTYDPEAREAGIRFRQFMTCFPGESFDVPPTVIYPYKGSWHAAADIYRAWFLPNRKILEKPEWTRRNSGWLLAILKQQNDEVIVPYSDIGTFLSDAAEARGIDVLGLFGRGIGGHDRFYPDYSPDPKLGGEKALREGIAKAHEKGKRVILYTNGQLLDQDGTQFWPDTGKFITVLRKDGTLDYQKWHKYADAPARIHGMACQRSEVWRDIMLRLARQAASLGADGLLYDQLGTKGPYLCYSPDHGHTVPAIVYENDRNDNMAYVQEIMARENPDFIVMTEGLVDAEMNTIGMFHGCGEAAGIRPLNAFRKRFTGDGSLEYYPELFHYTFPELITTIRHPNPSNSRYVLNYQLAFGFRNEMELRYAADRKYVEDGIVPDRPDYGNVLGPPSLDMLREAGDPAEAVRYYKQALTFQKEHADLFMEGRFLSDRDVQLDASSPCVLASAFAAEGKLGVLVWNVSDEPVTYKVSVPGYRATGLCAPDREVAEGDAIPAQSVVLVLMEPVK